jgi:flagellar hook assembly protein FlgD
MQSMKMLVALGALASIVQAGDYSTWARYRPVTLNTSNLGLSAAVANFPLSVRFKASTHKDMLDSAATQVQANGSDIRVTLADGTTDVPFEIEQLTTGPGGVLHLWVLAANVPSNTAAAATYRVYWGKTGQTTMSAPAAVFPTSAGFQAVFHMNDTAATITNAANPSLNGTAIGTATAQGQSAGNGVVSARSGARVRTFGTSAGGSADGAGAVDYIRFTPGPTHVLSTHNGPLTMEGWVYSSVTQNGNSSPGTKTIIAHGNASAANKAWLARTAAADGSGAQNHYSAGGAPSLRGPIAPFQEQHHWQYVAAVWNGTNYTIYRQRESDPWNNATISGPSGMVPDSVHYKIIPGIAPAASTDPWYIGADSSLGAIDKGWQGWMEEVRISTIARDSNYVKLNFATFRSDTIAGSIHPVSVGATELNVTTAYSAWSGHRTIVLNTSATGANVASTVTNFPVLVRLGTAEAAIIAAANGGNSIRFSKANDATALPYEIESWSPTAAAIWVKVDTVKGNNATQTIRMHWGNAAATSQSNGAAVFDTANGYRAVYHMSGTTTESDATINALTMSPSDTVSGAIPAPAEGQVGGARNFLGDATTIAGRQYFVAANSAANPAVDASTNQPHTITAWVYARTISAANGHGNSIFNKGDNQYALQIYGNSGATAKLWESAIYTSTWRQAKSKGVAVAGAWYQITGTWSGGVDGDSGTGKLYVNGVLDTTIKLGIGTTNPNRTYNLFIGANPSAGGANLTAPGTPRALAAQTTNTTRPRYWDGYLDEITFSRTVRSDDFVKLSYANQKSVNSLTDIGLPVYTVPGQPTSVAAVADTAKGRITWVAPSNNGGKPILEYKAMVVGDTALSCVTTTLTCTIPDLSSTATYNVVVRASNEVGAGPNSAASNAFTPVAPIVPTAPLTPAATTVSSSQVNVTYTAPAYNGGAAITGYTVTANPGGITCVTTELNCAVVGLNQGTAYTFTVQASNVAGNGASSASVTATTTSLLPGAFAIHMDGARTPYTYRLPAAMIAVTEKLTMTITDVQGKTVWSSTINPMDSKVGEIVWNGKSAKGSAVASGMYVVRLRAVMGGTVIESINRGVKF